MIESAVVIAVGLFLLWLSRKSRGINQRIERLSPKAKNRLLKDVKRDHRKHYLVGGSVSKVPGWVVIAVLLAFAVALWAGVNSVG